MGRPSLILVESNAGNIVHDQIIIRDALFVQVVNEPAFFQIASRGSAEVTVIRCRALTRIVGFAADAPPFFTHPFSHLQNFRGAMKTVLLCALKSGTTLTRALALCPAMI